MRTDVPSWDEYFLDLADKAATRSKDHSTQVGCIIVGTDFAVLSTGYNDLPRGIGNLPERFESPAKYLWIEHAERNAIYMAARRGTALNGSTIYMSSMPCTDCARAIIQSGIRRIVTRNPFKISNSGSLDHQLPIALNMLREAEIGINHKQKETHHEYSHTC